MLRKKKIHIRKVFHSVMTGTEYLGSVSTQGGLERKAATSMMADIGSRGRVRKQKSWTIYIQIIAKLDLAFATDY